MSSDKLVPHPNRQIVPIEPDAPLVRWVPGEEIHLEMLKGARLSGIIRQVTEEGILIEQPHRKAVIWIRRDQVAMASNNAIWI